MLAQSLRVLAVLLRYLLKQLLALDVLQRIGKIVHALRGALRLLQIIAQQHQFFIR